MSRKQLPPRWADRFLEWYCRPELLEEIQGDAYELFKRTYAKSPLRAKWLFVWNVLRFFRLRNIRKKSHLQTSFLVYIAMIQNIILVTLRNFMRNPLHSFINLMGLSVGLTCVLFIILWSSYEFSYDRSHTAAVRIFKVLSHVESDGTFQTYDVASVALDVSTVPEVSKIVSVASGSRWPFELCFRPDEKLNECVYLNGVYASEDLFSVFSFPIVAGDPQPLKHNGSIAISEKMSQMLFGDKSPLGKTIKIDDTREVVIATVFQNIPDNSSIQFDFALPYAILKKQWGINDDQFSKQFFNIYLLTHQVIPAAQLTDRINREPVLTEAIKQDHISYEAYPFADWHLKSKFENGKNTGGQIEYVYLFLLLGALVVLMAVINFVNLSMARATLRAKEIGIRKVTGAGRGAISMQFLGEAFATVLVSFIISLFLVQMLSPLFNTLLGKPIVYNIWSGNLPLYLFVLLSIVVVLAGAYPAWVMSSFEPTRILKNQLNTGGSRPGALRKTLLVIQLTVSVVIVVFSGVLYQQLHFIQNKNIGFDRDHVLRIEPTYRLLLKFDVFKQELLKSPFISMTGTAGANPLNSGGGNTGVTWPGKLPDNNLSFKTIPCSYEFPGTIGLQILQGRDFKQENSDSLRTEVLLTESAVAAMGLSQPIGEEIQIGQSPCVIIGIVNNFHTSSLHETMLPVILYRIPHKQSSAIYVNYENGKTAEALEYVKQVYRQFEPSFTMRYWFQNETYQDMYKTEVIASRLILVFTCIALIIAFIGIFGLVMFNLTRKIKEIGIRIVFGATSLEVYLLLFNQFFGLLIMSLLIAIPVAWLTANTWLQGFAYRIEMPWWIFVSSGVCLAALILSIIWMQAFVTLRTNPSTSLTRD